MQDPLKETRFIRHTDCNQTLIRGFACGEAYVVTTEFIDKKSCINDDVNGNLHSYIKKKLFDKLDYHNWLNTAEF